MLDSYTKDMLFKNIINEYSDAEQLDIIEYLVNSLDDLQGKDMKKGSIEEIYHVYLSKIQSIILDLKVADHDWQLDKELEVE